MSNDNVVAFPGQPRPVAVPDFVDTSIQIQPEQVAELISSGTTVYYNLKPIKLLFDVEGNGAHIFYKEDAQYKRFGLVMAQQLTTKPVMYQLFNVDGSEMPTQPMNIREMAAATVEELAQVNGVFRITPGENGGFNVEQVHASARSQGGENANG